MLLLYKTYMLVKSLLNVELPILKFVVFVVEQENNLGNIM